MAIDIGRREFVTALGSAAAAWPLAARAQQQSRERRIGLLMSTPNDSLGQAWFAAFAQGLQQFYQVRLLGLPRLPRIGGIGANARRSDSDAKLKESSGHAPTGAN
jgi:hypothetical protein